jgi:hypothetical protein
MTEFIVNFYVLSCILIDSEIPEGIKNQKIKGNFKKTVETKCYHWWRQYLNRNKKKNLSTDEVWTYLAFKDEGKYWYGQDDKKLINVNQNKKLWKNMLYNLLLHY